MSVETKYAITKLNNMNLPTSYEGLKCTIVASDESAWKNIIPDPLNSMMETWNKKDSVAYATIELNVEDEQLNTITKNNEVRMRRVKQKF